MKYLIGMTSITYAMKAKELLNANKIRCKIVSTPKSKGSGCGYSLSVSGDVDLAIELLKKNSIKYLDIY